MRCYTNNSGTIAGDRTPLVDLDSMGGESPARMTNGQAPMTNASTKRHRQRQRPLTTVHRPFAQPGADFLQTLGQLLLEAAIDRAVILALDAQVVLRGDAVGASWAYW